MKKSSLWPNSIQSKTMKQASYFQDKPHKLLLGHSFILSSSLMLKKKKSNPQNVLNCSPEIIHVCVQDTHSSPFHTRAVHLCAGHFSSTNSNRSSATTTGPGTSDFKFLLVISHPISTDWKTYLLLTTATAQQSPCCTSGRPLEGTTTPGNMRSYGKRNVWRISI